MARRIINRISLVRTTMHPDLHQAIERFRTEYMKMNGAYINNSLATKLLAKKVSKAKPPKLKRRRFYAI